MESIITIQQLSVPSLIINSIDYTIHEININALHLFGWNSNEVLHRNIEEIIPHFFVNDLINESLVSIQYKRKKINVTYSTINESYLIHFTLVDSKIIELERKVNELKKSKDFLSGLINSLDFSVVFKDIQGKYVHVNKFFCDFLGKTEKDIIGMNDFQLTNNVNAEIYNRVNETVYKEKKRSSFKTNYKNPVTNQTTTIVINSVPMFNEMNEVIGLAGYSQDITEIIETQLELEEQREKLMNIFDNIDALVFKIGQDHCFSFIEGRFVEKYNIDTKDYIGYHVSKHIHSEHVSNAYKLARQGVKNSVIVNHEMGHFKLELSPFKDGTNHISGVLGMFTDFTDIIVHENQMKTQNQLLNNLIDAIPDLIFFKDLENRYLGANKAFIDFYNIENKEDLIGSSDDIVYYEEPIRKFIESQNQDMLNHKKMVRYELDILNRKNNEKVHHEVIKTLFKQHDGTIGGIIGIARDNTEQKALVETLNHERKYLRTILSCINDIVLVLDSSGNIGLMNSSAEKLTLWKEEEVIGRNIFDLMTLKEEFSSKVITLNDLKSSIMLDNALLYDRHFNTYYVNVRSSIMKDEKGAAKGIVLTIRDMTLKRLQDTEINYLMNHDSLTSIYNRSFFEQEIVKFDKISHQPLSFIVVDINGLKITNSLFGYSLGDRLIVEITNILKSVRRSDDLLARIGEDEFILVLPSTNQEVTEEIVELIQMKCLGKRYELFNKFMFIPSVSIGTATKTKAWESTDQVIKLAEQKMFENKINESILYQREFLTMISDTLNNRYTPYLNNINKFMHYFDRIGEVLDFSEQEIANLKLTAKYQNIGLIRLNKEIYLKETKLSNDDWIEIKKHPREGFNIAKKIPEINHIANFILTHHERYDGKGYPRGLKGEEIPVISRIVSIVDAYVAMSTDRPYRLALPKHKIIKELKNNAGKQFDPQLVELFINEVVEQQG